MKVKNIYLSGAIHGHDLVEVWQRFEAYENMLNKKGEVSIVSPLTKEKVVIRNEYRVFNPLKCHGFISAEDFIARRKEKTRQEYLKADINVLVNCCEYIAMMPGWEKSFGSSLEWRIAKSIGYGIEYLLDLDDYKTITTADYGKTIYDITNSEFVADFDKRLLKEIVDKCKNAKKD